MNIDIIIPVYKPDKSLFSLIEKLEQQTISFQNIVLMNTEEKYFTQLIYGTRFLEQHKKVKVYHLSKREFDHGGTRYLGVKKTSGDVFLMMTQDAVPADERMLEELVAPLQDNVAVAYARQIPKGDCNPIEQYIRCFNYPPQAKIKTMQDLPQLGIKTYFCSNVCAAYRRKIYEELGGFIRHTIFNEDMIYAAKAIQAGYAVAYQPQAKVVHSHNYTKTQLFRRNFDLGVSQADHPEVFADLPSAAEGKKLVAQTTSYLWKNHMASKIPSLYLQSAFKYMGYLFGKHYQKLPEKWVAAMSDNKEYWKQERRRKDVEGIDASKGYGRTAEEEKQRNHE